MGLCKNRLSLRNSRLRYTPIINSSFQFILRFILGFERIGAEIRLSF